MLKFLMWVVGAVVLFLVIGAMINNTPEGQARRKARDTIAYCWEQQGRKSLDPGSQRLVASACEKLEDDFVRKYNTRP